MPWSQRLLLSGTHFCPFGPTVSPNITEPASSLTALCLREAQALTLNLAIPCRLPHWPSWTFSSYRSSNMLWPSLPPGPGGFWTSQDITHWVSALMPPFAWRAGSCQLCAICMISWTQTPLPLFLHPPSDEARVQRNRNCSQVWVNTNCVTRYVNISI